MGKFKENKERTLTQTEFTRRLSGAIGTSYEKADAILSVGGEVGQELVVRDGRFFTIGDNSAEFFQYKKGDIIFNAEQTKQIFENGKILYGKKRGKAFVTGSAFADASTGAGVRYSKTATTGYWTPVSSSNYTPSSSYTRTGNTANTTSGETAFDKFKNWLDKLFDWTEIKLERQTRKIEKYTSRADAALEAGSYRNAATNYRKAILSSSTQITNNENAAKKYKETADQVLSNAIGQGLISKDKAENIAKAVANGSINISSYSEEVQKVVQSYQEWYEKSLSCADAVETLHQNIRKYVQSLKDVRDTQRDTTLETIDLYSAIGTSGYTNTSSGYYGLKNSQLIYANKQLNSQNAAYATEVNNVTADANNLGKTANTAIDSQLKTNNNSSYNKALKNAQSAIKVNKPISSSDLSTIKNYSTSTYEQLYAYNLQLSNVETAKLEQATAYAANSSDIYSNIAETYNNKDTANSNKLDLYKQQAENATDAKSANESLLNAIQRYNTILDDDQAEISQYTTDVKTKQSIIKKDNTNHRGLNYSSLSQSAKANVDKYIDSVQSSVTSRKAISANILAQLAKYYSKGYITLAFYQACIDYNNALEYRRQANIQYALDQETVKAEKAAIGTQMLENVMQEYTNKVNTNSTKTAAIQTAQSLKTTKGISLSKSDYNDLINQSKIDQQIYADEVSAIDNQIKLNLTNGVWTTSSQEYKDALITLEEYKDKVNQCVVQQEEWNNSIVNMELEKYEKLLDLLDAISSYNDSLINLAKAEGKVVTATNIQQQISDRYEQADTLQQERNVAYQNYQKALSNSDNVYGGKTADEWKSQYMQLGTSINQVKIEITNLYDDLNSIELNKLISQLDQLSDASNRLQDALNIKEAKGIKATIQDYQELIANSNERVLNLQKENVELSTQLQSYEKGSDKYNECLKQINSNDSSIREATKSQIEWNNAIIELPIEKLENLLDVLESIAKYNKSVTELKIASGQVVNYVDYQKQIADINDQISVLEEKRSILFRNYQEALLDSNGVYGGKTADEWKKQFNELGAKINNSKADIEELKDKINEIKLDRLSADLSSLADAQDKLKDSISLKKERGQYATESDYNALISNSKQQVLNLQAQNAELQKQQSLTEKYSEKYEELQRNIEDNEQSIRDAAIAQEEWNNAIINLPYERIEKILNKLDTIADYNKSLSDLKAAKGEDLSLEDYTQQISDNNATIAQLEEKRTNAYSDYLSALTNSDGVYGGKTADEWLSEFKKFGTEINNLYADNESIKDSLRDDVYWRTYERAHDACEQYANVLSGLTELIDESMYFDSDGYLTDFGISKIAILVGEYENAREEAQNYSNDIKNLNSLYTQGYYTQTEYFEKLSELQSGLLESASDMKSIMSEITDMYKQSAQYELDNLFKIIDARNDALAAKKEYYDYDKTISSKTKDIQSLQAQIAALDGIETAEAKSKRATLQAELSNAQDDLNDTINNHMFELSQNSLNDMKDALQDAFDDKWEDISGSLSEISNLMASANDLIYTSSATINSTFDKLLNYYGMSSLSVGIEGGTSYMPGVDNNIQNVWTVYFVKCFSQKSERKIPNFRNGIFPYISRKHFHMIVVQSGA